MKDLDIKSTPCSLQNTMSTFFHFAFAVPLAAQLFSLVKEAAHPTELKTSMSKESLSTFDHFPLLGRICVTPGLDVEKLTKYGYADPSSFYMGVSRFNDSILGWSGHMENGSVFSIKGKKLDELREGLPFHSFPKYRHCLDGGGLTIAWIFVKDLSTCTEGPQW